MQNNRTNYYEILGVPNNATKDDIRKAWRKLSLKHHPDRGGNEEEFKKLNRAFEVLGDPQKKKEYDFGKLIAKNFDIQNFNVKWIRDKNSEIIVNDKLIKEETKKIIPIIYEKKLFLLK